VAAKKQKAAQKLNVDCSKCEHFIIKYDSGERRCKYLWHCSPLKDVVLNYDFERKIFTPSKKCKGKYFSLRPSLRCRECGKEGVERVDKGLAAGVHCDPCWEKLVSECRKRSW
jgi:hypothetical protein